MVSKVEGDEALKSTLKADKEMQKFGVSPAGVSVSLWSSISFVCAISPLWNGNMSCAIVGWKCVICVLILEGFAVRDCYESQKRLGIFKHC